MILCPEKKISTVSEKEVLMFLIFRDILWGCRYFLKVYSRTRSRFFPGPIPAKFTYSIHRYAFSRLRYICRGTTLMTNTVPINTVCHCTVMPLEFYNDVTLGYLDSLVTSLILFTFAFVLFSIVK